MPLDEKTINMIQARVKSQLKFGSGKISPITLAERAWVEYENGEWKNWCKSYLLFIKKDPGIEKSYPLYDKNNLRSVKKVKVEKLSEEEIEARNLEKIAANAKYTP